MKNIFLGATALLLLGIVALPANALQHGQLPPRERDRVDPVVYGTFKASARRVDPHYGPDGTYQTYVYYHLTANTMDSCVYQLGTWLANPGVTVVQYCHQSN